MSQWKLSSIIILQANCSPPLTHELNGSGSLIWTLLGPGPKSYGELLEELTKAFDAKEEIIESDLTELINKLVKLELVRILQ